MAYENYELLKIAVDGGIARATIDHPPVNLFDIQLMGEVDRFSKEVAVDADVRVVVLDSANPDFFIAHADVAMILMLPRTPAADTPTELGFFHRMVERFRTMPKATIAIVEGCARGGGAELLWSMDMRFASRERAVFGQPEVALGILPGGSGTQRLPALIGRGRALEMVLGGGDVDAVTAEAWGCVNRALPDAELRPFVDALAARIASFPSGAIARAKAAVLAADADPVPGLHREWQLFSACLADPVAAERMERFLSVGGQTPEVERNLELVYPRLA